MPSQDFRLRLYSTSNVASCIHSDDCDLIHIDYCGWHSSDLAIFRLKSIGTGTKILAIATQGASDEKYSGNSEEISENKFSSSSSLLSGCGAILMENGVVPMFYGWLADFRFQYRLMRWINWVCSYILLLRMNVGWAGIKRRGMRFNTPIGNSDNTRFPWWSLKSQFSEDSQTTTKSCQDHVAFGSSLAVTNVCGSLHLKKVSSK